MGKPMKLSGLKVSNLMSPNVICINEDDSVALVIQIFSRCHISGAPVINVAGEYVGVVSKTDLFARKLLEYMEQNGSLTDLPVRCIMNPNPPLTLDEQTTVEKAAEVMLEKHVHRVFIQSNGHIVGIVSSYDILKVVANVDTTEAVTLETNMEQQLLNIKAHLQEKKRIEYKRTLG
jgi:CBS domain-containing protein